MRVRSSALSTPAKNLTGCSTTLRTTSTKLFTGLERSNSPPDADLLTLTLPLCAVVLLLA